jgi:ATP-dependent metalloprotease
VTLFFSSQVDSEIKRMLSDSYERAKNILKTHAKEHKALAEALLKYETLDADDIRAILSGGKHPAEASKR